MTTTVYIGNYFEWKGSPSTMVKYYYAGATRVAMRTGAANPLWLLGDHLGSTSVVANYDGTIYSGQGYYAWGEKRYSIGVSPLPTTFRYTGQREAEGLGLYFYGARWYDGALGRFIQADTIVPLASQGVQAWDRYAYTTNNPLRFTDPTGHSVDCAIGEYGCEVGKMDKASRAKLYDDYYDLDFTKNDPHTWKSEQWKIWNNLLTELTESDTPGNGNYTILWGWNGSASGAGPYLSGGQEEIVILDDGTRATYNYLGDGDAYGAGASTTAYIGIATNVINPESYKGNAATVGVTVSVADIGITIAYFWNTDSPPLTPGNTQGCYIGYSPGAQFSVWRSNAVYDLTWTSH